MEERKVPFKGNSQPDPNPYHSNASGNDPKAQSAPYKIHIGNLYI